MPRRSVLIRSRDRHGAAGLVARAGRATDVTMAVLAGLLAMTGIEHGIGEIRQGPVAPRSLVIESWPDSPAFEVLAGEPALTVVPNLAYRGILAVLISLLAATWAAVAAHRRHGGLVLVGLCGVLLVVGGGFGPPLLGTVLGLTLTLAQRRAPRSIPDAGLARWWPWPLVVATASFLGLFPGTVLLQQLTDLDAAWVVPVLTLMGFTGAVVAVLAARARDHQRTSPSPETPAATARPTGAHHADP